MSNHYPHPDRYVPSRYLPTHYYRKHHEFGIPFKRYPLNYDEHEESGYYIDFNQTHLVYAVPCTDITFSKRYNRDDLKNETIDTTAETRETVGTTAARYHENTHSRHYPHCAHSSHVQGFDVLTITKLMDYEMQLHDVTPERLKVLFENFACPQRDTVVFEHVWIEQHKFLSMYFKVHKKPLLDYCLFRFPEPPVCPGPGPTPGEGPRVLTIIPTVRYVDPETCVVYVDFLVTFDKAVNPLVSDLKEIFGVRNGITGDEQQVLNVVQTAAEQMVLTATIDVQNNENFESVYVDTRLWNVEDIEGNAGEGTQSLIVPIGDEYQYALTVSYQDHYFDEDNNKTRVWLAYSRFIDNVYPNQQEEVPVDFVSSNTQAIYNGNYLEITDPVTGVASTYYPEYINTHTQHDGHDCVEFIFDTLANADPTKDVSFTGKAYLFKYLDTSTNNTYINVVDESFVLQWSNLERVISNYGLMSNSEQEVTGLWVIYPCESTDIVSVDLSKITRAPYEDLEDTVHPIAYNLGNYVQEGGPILQAGREVFLTFSPNITFSDRYTYTINAEAITDDSNHHNAYWVHAIPDPEPEPQNGPILTGCWGEYDPSKPTNKAKLECVFDQDIEIVDTNGIQVVYADDQPLSVNNIFMDLTLNDFYTFMNDLISYVQNDIEVVPEGGTPDPNYNKVDYYFDYIDPVDPSQADWELRHPNNGEIYGQSAEVLALYPYIGNTDAYELSWSNQQFFAASSINYYSAMYGFLDAYTTSMIQQFLEDHATRNSLTVADMLDGTHNNVVEQLRYLAEYTLAHYTYWDSTEETDSGFQTNINALYNEPLGGQTYPDEAILTTQSLVNALSTELSISVSDLLTDVNYAYELRSSIVNAARALIFIQMLTSACTETYMLSTLNSIYDGTYQLTNVGTSATYYPFTNWITVDRITFSTRNTNLVMEFDEPLVRERSIYIHIPINTVRNPNSGYVNREGKKYTYMDTPEIVIWDPYGTYDSSTNATTIWLNFNNPVNFIGGLNDIEITDGINTAHPTSVTASDPSSPSYYELVFDNTAWAGNQTIDLSIAQGAFENAEDPTYTNDAYTHQMYIWSDQPPTVTHTVTYDAQGGSPEPAPEIVNDGGSATIPPAPTKQYYAFDYWTLNGVQYDWGPVYSDITLVASWTYVGPVATAPTILSISSTDNTGGDYTLTITWDQVINAVDPLSVTVSDGVNTETPTSYQVNGSSLELTFGTPYPTDWISGASLTVDIPASTVTDSTSTIGNAAETLPNFVFGQAYPYPPTPVVGPSVSSINAEKHPGTYDPYWLYVTFDQPIDNIDSTKVTVSDGVNTAHPDVTRVQRIDSYTMLFPFDNAWIDNGVALTIDQGCGDSGYPDNIPSESYSDANVVFQLVYYTCSFDAQGGSPTPADQTVACGDYLTQPANPSRSGYNFRYWSLDPNDTTGIGYDFTTQKVLGAFILYAIWEYVPTPTPVSPTNQYPKKNGSTVSPIYVHNFGGGNSHLSLYLKYDTKVDNGHSYIKLKDSSFKCEGNQAFFGWTIQTVRVKVGSTTVKELSNIYHSTSDTNWSEDFNTNWIDLGAVQTGTGAATLNVYAKSNSSGTYTGFEFNENYDCTIAHNELV